MPNILVVDDSLTDRRLAVGLLEKLPGAVVFEAQDGRDALRQCELHLPDLVVSDVMMPSMNGLELVAAVKEQYPLVPIIIMTSLGSEEIAAQALQKGAASYVPKRVLAQDLPEVAERTLATAAETRNQSRLLHRMTRREMTFELETDLTLVCAVSSFLRHDAQHNRLFAKNECLRVGVAIEEALLNAYFHGNLEISSDLRETDYKAYNNLAKQRVRESPYKERKIEVKVAVSATQVIYTVRDEGPGFDPARLPDPTDPKNLDRPCGRGLLLMRTFMDNVIYNDAGNEVTLFKERELDLANDVEE